jgi:hypothetical protein
MEVPLMVQEGEGAQAVFLAEQTETMDVPGPNKSMKDP